jgi:two-component system phosphate regulon sensor histidine kinase PhoR
VQLDKNLSPHRIAVYTALVITSIACILVILFHSVWWHAVMFSMVLFVLVYYIFRFVLAQFIQRRVKVIYKLIAETKATRREEFFHNELLPPKTIAEVEKEVEEWAEDRNKKIEKLESNEQFRKEFLLNLSHELKTPIFAAQNYIETLQNGALHDEQVNIKFLDKTANSIQRLVALVDDLDEITKYEIQQVKLKKEEFVIQEIIREVFEEVALKQQHPAHKFYIKLGCEKPLTVLADKNKIRQVLFNLIENSIKYGRIPGETSAGIYEVDERTLLVEVNDNGIGIAPEHVPRVFERFFRTDLGRSRKVGGSGLGLAIVKHIVEAHGGNVLCRSTLDIGTTVGFTLPRINT